MGGLPAVTSLAGPLERAPWRGRPQIVTTQSSFGRTLRTSPHQLDELATLPLTFSLSTSAAGVGLDLRHLLVPNDAALSGLVTAVLVDQHHEWHVAERRYLSEESMALVDQSDILENEAPPFAITA